MGPNAITGHYLTVNGYETYYEEAGYGQPVVCLAMIGASGAQYHYLLRHNASEKYRYIALDLPGHGRSLPDMETLEPILDMEVLLDFITAFLDALGLERPILLGQAMTATAALILADRFPKRFRAVIAVNGGVIPRAAHDPEYLAMLDSPNVNLGHLKASHFSFLCGREVTPKDLNYCKWYGAYNQVSRTVQADNILFVALSKVSLTDALDEVPFLLLTGGDDETLSAGEIACLQKRPRCRPVVIPGAGHYLIMEQPEKCARAIQDYTNAILPEDEEDVLKGETRWH